MKIRIITSSGKRSRTYERTVTESRVVGKVTNPLPTIKIGVPTGVTIKTKLL